MFTLIKLGYIFEAKEYKSVCESLNMMSLQNDRESAPTSAPTSADRRRKSSDLKSSDTEVIVSKKTSASDNSGAADGIRKFKNSVKAMEDKRKAL